MQEFIIDGHEPSLLPNGNWQLVWADEFDGTELDRTKWNFRLHFWGRRFKPYTDQGVELKGDSLLRINLIKNGDDYCSAQLQTGANSFDAPKEIFTDERNASGDNHFWPLGKIEKPTFMHRYGYYEVRCKFQEKPGWWSAFWLQSPSIGTSYNPEFSGVEVDIMECFSPDNKVTSGNFYGGYGTQLKVDARTHYEVKDTPDGFHRFGLLWTPEEYIFYCDGEETARTSGPISQVEQFILLTTECQGYRRGQTASDELKTVNPPDAFVVDYVRVYDLK